jgi:uncharacterized phage-associated protein
MASLIDVAKYILNTKKDTTAMKLHKILFYCQVWHHIWHNELLIDEANFSILENGIQCVTLRNKIFELVMGNPNNLSLKQTQSIDSVLSVYGELSIHELIFLNKKEIPPKSLISFPEITHFYQSSQFIDNAPY